MPSLPETEPLFGMSRVAENSWAVNGPLSPVCSMSRKVLKEQCPPVIPQRCGCTGHCPSLVRAGAPQGGGQGGRGQLSELYLDLDSLKPHGREM